MKRVFNPANKKTILMVHDDDLVAQAYREQLQSAGFKVEAAEDGARAMQVLENNAIALVLLDLGLARDSGIEVLERIRGQFARLPVVVFFNPFLLNLERTAMKAGACKSVVKTKVPPPELPLLIQALLPHVSELPITEKNLEIRTDTLRAVTSKMPEILARVHGYYQILSRMEGGELRQVDLRKMQRHIHLLAGCAGVISRPRIAQIGNAFAALITELQARPSLITSSVLRTVGQAIDTLSALLVSVRSSDCDSSPAPKILAVDDEAIAREMALTKAELPCEGLSDSLAAQRRLEAESFDLIFLDVEMPVQSGLELCVKIRQMRANSATPVVFVTSHSDFGSRAQSTLSGGNDFIAKPFQATELAIKALTHLFTRNLRPLPKDQRSTSPMTISTLPRMTMTSATV